MVYQTAFLLFQELAQRHTKKAQRSTELREYYSVKLRITPGNSVVEKVVATNIACRRQGHPFRE